jgi:TDG/mug DNA glycosylase family protein
VQFSIATYIHSAIDEFPRSVREMNVPVRGLGPVVDDRSRVLILGTMPGSESLNREEYYADPKNQFWNIVYEVFGSETARTYKERVSFILARRIALWDVLKYCERKGSLDRGINGGAPNDFHSFFTKHPGIKHIFFNGDEARRLFKNMVHLDPEVKLGLELLPSSSGTNTHIDVELKVKRWKVIRDCLREDDQTFGDSDPRSEK